MKITIYGWSTRQDVGHRRLVDPLPSSTRPGGGRHVSVPVQELLAEGWAALRAGDAAAARRTLERALASSPSGEVLEGAACAAHLELDFPRAMSPVEFFDRTNIECILRVA
jgi:hypothetical protein